MFYLTRSIVRLTFWTVVLIAVAVPLALVLSWLYGVVNPS